MSLLPSRLQPRVTTASGVVIFVATLAGCAEPQQASAESRADTVAVSSAERPAADSLAIARLVAQLGDPDLRKAEAARDQLNAIGPAAVPALTGALGHDDPQVVWLAAEAMKGFGDAVSPAVPALLPALTRLRGRQEAQRVSEALLEVGPGAAPHVPLLIDHVEALVQDPTQRNPWSGHLPEIMPLVQVFGAIGPEARDAVPLLLTAWQRYKGSAGRDAPVIRALGATADPRALAALDSALRATKPSAHTGEHETHTQVARAMALAGEPGAVLLDQAYTIDHAPIRLAVVHGYAALGEAGVSRLGRVLEDARPCEVSGVPDMHRALALQSLREQRQLPASLLPALRTVVRDSKHPDAPRIARELIARLQS